MFGIAAVVIDEEPFDRRRPGALKFFQTRPALQKFSGDAGTDFVKPLEDLRKAHLQMRRKPV